MEGPSSSVPLPPGRSYDLDPESLPYPPVPPEFQCDPRAYALLQMIRTGEIWFPFHRYISLPGSQLFRNLREVESPVLMGNYKLRSYLPKFSLYLPSLFRGQYVRVSATTDSYEKADVLSDLYVEDVRLQAKRLDTPLSMMEVWVSDKDLLPLLEKALTLKRITPSTLRQLLYDNIPETKTFRPSWVKGLLRTILNRTSFQDLTWLDFSSGWGDRLLIAMVLGIRYLGYDPNTLLRPGHEAMIQDFGDPAKHQIRYEPFEKATLPSDFQADIILTSPPFFNVEEYASGQEGQSIVSYPTYEKWMVHFLFLALLKAWSVLKNGGYLILSVGDNVKVPICEPMLLFIERYLVGASWEGVIGIQGVEGYPRPVWVWRKVCGHGERPRRWNSRLPRSLQSMYPAIHKELLTLIGTHGSLKTLGRRINTKRTK